VGSVPEFDLFGLGVVPFSGGLSVPALGVGLGTGVDGCVDGVGDGVTAGDEFRDGQDRPG
jgi:hypothetical protein